VVEKRDRLSPEVSMHAAVALALLALAAPPAAAAQPAPARTAGAQLSEDERAFCASELEVVERRQKVFESQGLSSAEVALKNEGATRDLAECRTRFKEQKRRDAELEADTQEAARRAGPDATPPERDKAWREVRRERLATRSPSSLTAEEKAELDEGMQEEMKATHQALDAAHQRDPAFLRVLHSAIACYQGERRTSLKEAIASEERLAKAGSGNRQRLYGLKSELRATEEVLARNADAAKTLPNGLDKCSAPTIRVIAHCLGSERAEPACGSEDVQQYVRMVK
jgi:hypothetical protein